MTLNVAYSYLMVITFSCFQIDIKRSIFFVDDVFSYSLYELHSDKICCSYLAFALVSGEIGCSYCGGLGHRITDCPKLEAMKSKEAQNIGRKDYLASNAADW